MSVLRRTAPLFVALGLIATACTPETAQAPRSPASTSPTPSSAAGLPTKTSASPDPSPRINTPTAVGKSAPTSTATIAPEATPSRTATSEPLALARAVLDQFMEARIERRDPIVHGFLTASLRSWLENHPADSAEVRLVGVSNPCWYRYEVLDFRQPMETEVVASVRVYQHFWGGDEAGGLPRSWQQEIHLTSVAGGWQIDRLGSVTQEREEPGEPHGPHRSACSQ